MGIYSETMSNTPDDLLKYPTTCHNCHEDCMGVWLKYLVPEGDRYD